MDFYDLPFVKRTASNAFIYRFVAPLKSNSPLVSVTRFSKYSDINNVWLGVGTEFGEIAFYPADEFLNYFDYLPRVKLTEHAITDLYFMNNHETVIALSMLGDVFVVNMSRGAIEKKISSEDGNHTAFAGQSNDPYCYVIAEKNTGGLKYMDMRKPNNMAVASAQPRSVLTPRRGNLATPKRGQAKSPRRPGTPTTPTSKFRGQYNQVIAAATCIKHVDDRIFAVGYTKAEKGIQLWDLRYVKTDAPCCTFQVPPKYRSNFGVASLNLKSDHSTLLALCTDGDVRKYDISMGLCSSNGKMVNEPLRTYSGAIRGDFQVEFGVSPISDHMICGTDEGAGIWDMGERSRSFPKFGLKYVSSQMASCDWSENGRYIVGMTNSAIDSMFVLYDNDSKESESIQTGIPQNFSNPYLLT
uniref:WD_REPEATS_REGION domain-containing protein n=1 Tax=Bursaphelenchus xylophilus TaxID=6326 RepID=A0A1I7RND9_BURXY